MVNFDLFLPLLSLNELYLVTVTLLALQTGRVETFIFGFFLPLVTVLHGLRWTLTDLQ